MLSSVFRAFKREARTTGAYCLLVKFCWGTITSLVLDLSSYKRGCLEQDGRISPLPSELTAHLLPNSSSSFSLSCGLSRGLERPSAFDLDPRLMASRSLRLYQLLRHQETFLADGVRNRQSRRSRKFLFSSAQPEQETASSTSLTPTFLLSLRDAEQKPTCYFHFKAGDLSSLSLYADDSSLCCAVCFLI